MTTERIKLAAIRTDGGTQMRAAIDPAVVEDYADAYRAGAPMPPVTVFYDGKDYWLGNGFHRVEAQRACTFADTEAEVRPGTRRDAVLHAAGANASNGLRPTNADKRRAIETLLRDDEWRRWSDNKIAKSCGVSNHFVATVKASLGSAPSEEPRRFVTKHGTEAVMNTSAIGRSPREPSAPLASAMTGAPPIALMPTTNLFAPPVAVNDGADDYEMLEADDTPADARNPKWSPPLHASLADNDDVFAAGEIERIASRFCTELGAGLDRLDPTARERVLRRAETRLLDVVVRIGEAMPWLRVAPGAEGARPVFQLIRGGK